MAETSGAQAAELLRSFASKHEQEFKAQKNILSFEEYLALAIRHPRRLCRNAAEYLKDMIDSFGSEERLYGHGEKSRHFKVFDRAGRRTRAPIVGQDAAHQSIYSVLEQFVRQGRIDKLILLHGPNGSSKSSTADALAAGLEAYSHTEEGAVYRFNWIFPTDKVGYEGLGDVTAAKRIGFGSDAEAVASQETFAHLADEEIMCKIISEMKENPIFLLPTSERIDFFRRAIRVQEGKEPSDAEIPLHLEEGCLGSKSKKIFDALLVAYNGDLSKVLRHVQVERFFFSGRYRMGIATVEPQMHMDAQDRQLTLDKNMQNLPPVLQNIRIFEPSGDLIDANRGFVEFSDLLKRPLEAFKYLLTAIENMSVNLTSGIADLDLVMLASANEKHLDAFKSTPDWPSFKGRFELVRVPYLLSSKLEQTIYSEDVKTIERTKPMGPHALGLLAKWAVLTRLKPADPEAFPSAVRPLIARMTPYDKLALFDGEEPGESYTELEKNELEKIVSDIRSEGQASLAYEGRFGASPREVKAILYFAAQKQSHDSLSALAVFDEIEALMRDRSVYEYLQFEVNNGFHDVADFLRHVRQLYARNFMREFLAALNLFDEEQYAKAFDRYLQHVVAYIRKERVFNDITHKNENPDENMMGEIEGLMGASGNRDQVRQAIMAKVASWKVDNRDADIDIRRLFVNELQAIARNIYESRKSTIERVSEGILMIESEDFSKLPAPTQKACEETLENLKTRFGYTRKNAWESLVFARKLGETGAR